MWYPLLRAVVHNHDDRLRLPRSGTACLTLRMRLIHGLYVNMSPRTAVMVSGKVSSGLLS